MRKDIDLPERPFRLLGNRHGLWRLYDLRWLEREGQSHRGRTLKYSKKFIHAAHVAASAHLAFGLIRG